MRVYSVYADASYVVCTVFLFIICIIDIRRCMEIHDMRLHACVRAHTLACILRMHARILARAHAHTHSGACGLSAGVGPVEDESKRFRRRRGEPLKPAKETHE
jgi:hypothetical protein